MVITKDTFINFHKETMAGKKYHLVFIIMTPAFLLISALGGRIGMGVVLSIFMGIYMLIMRSKEKKILKKLQKGEFTVTKDILIDKRAVRRGKNNHSFYLQSQIKFPKQYSVLPQFFRAVEVGDEFIVVEVDGKFVMLYNLRENTLSDEIEMMAR